VCADHLVHSTGAARAGWFNFSAYLGASYGHEGGILLYHWHPVLAWFGLFTPGILIVFGIMPFWGKFRQWACLPQGLPGLNAAGVGLIIASVFSLTFGALSVDGTSS